MVPCLNKLLNIKMLLFIICYVLVKVGCSLCNVALRGKSVRSWCDGSSDRSFMVDPLSYFSFQPVLHDWCNKGCSVRDGAYKRTLDANRKE